MKSIVSRRRRLWLPALLICAAVDPAARFADATIITGTESFQIVQRLTGPNITGHVGIGGTDLGHMVNHNGKTYFLFGDTHVFDGPGNDRRNVMAWTTDTDPTNGITFDDWLTGPDGNAKQVIFPGAEPVIPGFNPVTYIPTGAISVGDKIYAWAMRVDWSGGWEIGYAGLARWREGDSQFTTVPGFRFETPGGGRYSWNNGTQGPGNFGMVAASYRSPLEYSNDPHIYIWGTPGGREGGVKLARVLPGQIENLAAYEFFDGEMNGVPQWVDNEFDAQKIIPSRAEGGTGVGEMSVMYNEAMRAWTMTSIGGGIKIRYADNPWGPWSDPVDIPVTILPDRWGPYAPYMNSLYVEDDGRSIYFTMSYWEPYDVYLAKVDLDLDFRTRWEGNIGSSFVDSNWSHGRPTDEHHVTLDNGGRIRINAAESARAFDVGTRAGLGGTVEVWNTGALTLHAGGFRLGQGEGSNATLTMTGGSVEVLDPTRLFIVGDHGNATATISSGSITARTFSIGHQPTADGHVELSGDAVITTTGERFQLGRFRDTTTGERSVGSLTMTGGTINVNAGSGVADFVPAFEGVATVEISGGTINVANNFVAAVAGIAGPAAKSQATITHSGGTINTGAMTLGERGISDYTLSGTGQINARGLMRLGWFAGSQSTFTQNGGTVNVALNEPATTFVGLKVGEAGQGTYTINGGTLTVPGRVTIADLSGSTGQMNINGGGVSVGDLLRVRSGGTLNLDGGTLTAGSIQHNEGGAFNFTGGTLNVGTFQGDLTNTSGMLAPGNTNLAAATTVTGSYAQQAAAALVIDIGGVQSSWTGSEYDAVSVGGDAALGGQLQLALTGGFVPNASHTFTVLNASGVISGSFGNVASGERLTTVDGTGSFLVHYGTGSPFNQQQVVLSGFALAAQPGDFNQDGVVDAADYVVWRRGLSDGTMDASDYNEWTANFGANSGSGSAASGAGQAAVPAPGSLLLALLGCAAATFHRQIKKRK